MKIALFSNIQYNEFEDSLEKENMLICSWNHTERDNLMLVLVANCIGALQLTTLDLFAMDSNSSAPALRIVLNNGENELKHSMISRAMDLLDVIKRHNPDVEELIEQHPSFTHEILNGMVRTPPEQPLRVFTQGVSTAKRL